MKFPHCPECGTVLIPYGPYEICPKTTCKNYNKQPKTFVYPRSFKVKVPKRKR